MTAQRSRRLVAGWTVAGVVLVFVWAVVRLGSRGVQAIASGLTPFEWVALGGLTAAFVYGEGIRALDRRWVPGLIERARRLPDDPSFWMRLSGPLYGLCLTGRNTGTLVKGWLGTAAIVVAVIIIRALPDPWRGIVDFAVGCALAWGLVAILRRLPDLNRV